MDSSHLTSPSPLRRRVPSIGSVSPLNWLRGTPQGDEPLSARSHDEVLCTTPTGPKLRNLPTNEDPEVLCFGDELRLWAVSEYAVAASSQRPPRPQRRRSTSDLSSKMTSADVGGYVGTFFKDRKRRARTGRQPLACVPPVGDDAGGGFVESAFRCVDPRGLKRDGQPVRIGDALILQDREGHVWNSTVSGVVGYLAPRLRGERGETRIRFADDVQTPRSFGEKPDSGRAVRYGDALHLVTCPVLSSDPTHTGRSLRKPHVLTCFKKETSSLLGGYLTIDPRGYALQFVVERPPPELDVVIVGGEKHHRVAWGQSVPFSTASHVSLRLSGGGSASCSLAGLNAGDRKWLACSTRGHVLLEVRSSHAHDEDEEDEEIDVAAPHNPYELGLVWLIAQVVARLLFAPQLAAAVAASTSSAFAAARHDPTLARPAALVAFASASLAALSVQLCGDAVATALAAAVLLGAAATSPREETARPRLLRALSRVRTASGELALLHWSPEDDDALIAARSVDVSESNVLRDVPSSEELEAAGELRAELGEQPARWLETGELLRFVRARKTLKERASLFREAMAWRRDHGDWIVDEASFGGAEQRWCDDPSTAPAWHRWMGTVLPFELFGTCRSGVPITFVGLGRMDLTGIQREIGLDRLEQKMVMQNDAFIDLARREGLRRSSPEECVVAHGGVFVSAEIKILRCLRAESSRRPPRHRRDACSTG